MKGTKIRASGMYVEYTCAFDLKHANVIFGPFCAKIGPQFENENWDIGVHVEWTTTWVLF